MVEKEKPAEDVPEQNGSRTAVHIGRMPVVLICIALLGIVGWALAAVFIGTDKTSAENAAEESALELARDVTEGDYAAILQLVDTNDLPLLGLLISETTGREPGDVYIFEPTADLAKSRTAEEFARSFFPTLRNSLSEGNIKMLEGSKLADGHVLVAVDSYDRPGSYPLMMVKSGSDWKLDLAAQLVMVNGGETSRYVIDSVDELLKNPTEEDAARAVAIMEAAGSLEGIYDLWLEPAAKEMLPEEVSSGIEAGRALTPRFEELLEDAKAALKEVTGSEEPGESTPEPEPVPVPPEITTVEGEGEQVTVPFKLDQGLAVVHFDKGSGGLFKVILLDGSGTALGEVADYRGPISGSQAVGVAEGTYIFKVETEGPWTLGIEQPAPVQAPFPPQAFTGEGPVATPFFQTPGGPISVKMEHSGEGAFVVTVVELGGNSVALMANESGPFSGTRLVSLKSGTLYLLNVDNRGSWSISIEQLTD